MPQAQSADLPVLRCGSASKTPPLPSPTLFSTAEWCSTGQPSPTGGPWRARRPREHLRRAPKRSRVGSSTSIPAETPRSGKIGPGRCWSTWGCPRRQPVVPLRPGPGRSGVVRAAGSSGLFARDSSCGGGPGRELPSFPVPGSRHRADGPELRSRRTERGSTLLLRLGGGDAKRPRGARGARPPLPGHSERPARRGRHHQRQLRYRRRHQLGPGSGPAPDVAGRP